MTKMHICYETKPRIIALKLKRTFILQKYRRLIELLKVPINVWNNKIQVMNIQICTMP